MRKPMETKTHYKMYKSGKNWVFAGLVCGALLLSAGVTAQADNQTGAAAESAVTAVAPTNDSTPTSAGTATTTATATEATTETTATATSETAAPTAEAEVVGTTKPAAAVDDVTAPVTSDETAPTVVPEAPATPAVTVTPDSSAAAATEEATATLPATTEEAVGTTKPAGPVDAVTVPAATDPVTEPVGTTKPTASVDPVTPAVDDAPTVTPVDTPTATVDPIVEPTAVTPTATESALTDLDTTTRPAVAVTPVTTTAAVTVPETRPDLTNLPSALATSWTQPAVDLVQAELAKPATMTLAHTKETPAIDLWMPNKRLQQMVLAALQKLNASDKTWNTVADITQEDLARLKKLVAVGHNGMGTYIDGHTEFSLVGLEHAVNLETLMLTNTLDVGTGAFYGDIVDVTPLANLQSLTILDLQHNRIKDVTPLANLKHLKQLALAYNAIQDFSPLKDTVPRDPGDFTYTGQFILLDPVMINDADREGHLQVACTTVDGEVVQLIGLAAVAQPLFYVNGQHTYHVYFTGGNPKPDGQGGLHYTYIQDQKPGATSWPGDDSIIVDQLADYYYLTGVYKPQGATDFAVVQPYAISHSAASVTVHHVDEMGNEIAPSTTLKPGMVGEAYATTPEKIPGYVLQTTPDNATGVYGETAIDVTYIYAEEEADTEEGGQPTPGQPGQPGQPGTPTPEQPAPTPTPDPTPAPDGETPGGDQGQQPGDDGQTGGQGDHGNNSGGSQGGGQPGTPGSQGTGDHPTGSQPGTSTPGSAQQPGSAGPAVTNDAAGDTVLPGMTTPSATSNQTAGTVTALAHSHTAPTTTHEAGQTPATAAATTLPQTNDRTTPAAWGVALLVGLLGLVSFKRRVKE
ncbi:MucBP domain-containing protein [Levilactobacillus angrenensis]|uniref:MucBP domain-containing protein n=1 Tax=Levilactobacillus angrenensis TaxID=2486020 RepID=A0ABW1UA63_9LACO|nr:MucBP domain-containing protein [Levilactobacillus angrenensis]